VFQPCCNKGLDLLSIKNLGAARCFGFDISSEFIRQGRELAEAGKIDCELIQADVYDLDSSRDGQFDIGLITLGTFMWMPDLSDFFAAVRPLFRPEGWLFIHEFHPMSEVLRFEREAKGVRMRLTGNYFDQTPRLWTEGLDYFGGKQYEATPTHRFLHKISDIIEALVGNGFVIESFRELEENMKEGMFRETPRCPLPRSYTLTARYRPEI
jgi:ubiquinone/menaquinone biosynthesis C-methylase UbiE